MNADETRRSSRQWRETESNIGHRGAATGHRTPSPKISVISALALALGLPAAHGETGFRTRQSETPPPISVPFGSAAAAQIPEMRGTAIRPILEGVMSPPYGSLVAVNGHPMRLAPGATIRDQFNRIVLPGTLQRPVPVRFTLDHLGQIQKVRIMPGT